MENKDIFDKFEITENDDRKRFEFQSKTNEFTSYTVGYDEIDNIDDAKIVVYMAILKDYGISNRKR